MSDVSDLSMRIAVEMEVHAALSTTTLEKAKSIDLILQEESLPIAQPAGVRVKPLEWEDCGEEMGHCADVLFGRYWVEMVHSSCQVRLVTTLNEENHEIIVARGLGLEQGFSAAQADYASRILSAIEAAPPIDVESIIDAVLEIERYAPAIVPMGANPPLFDGMKLDNDGPWMSRVAVAKRLRSALTHGAQ